LHPIESDLGLENFLLQVYISFVSLTYESILGPFDTTPVKSFASFRICMEQELKYLISFQKMYLGKQSDYFSMSPVIETEKPFRH